jgi:hypothetical protein
VHQIGVVLVLYFNQSIPSETFVDAWKSYGSSTLQDGNWENDNTQVFIVGIVSKII